MATIVRSAWACLYLILGVAGLPGGEAVKEQCRTETWDDQNGHSGSTTVCLVAVGEGGHTACVGYSRTTDSFYNDPGKGSGTSVHESCAIPIDAVKSFSM